MTHAIRHVAIVTFVLFGALFVNLNYLQVLRADDLANDTRNARGLIEEYAVERGSILAADEQTEIAGVTETDGQLRYQRVYSDGELYAHVTGYHSFVFGRFEAEAAFNDFLVGTAPEHLGRNLADLLAGRERAGDNLVTTLQPAVQQAAAAGLGGRRGAAVAVAPGTGEVLALVSSPSYDPSRLSSFDGAANRQAWEELQNDERRPMANRALRERYPTGSVFKIVTGAAALEAGASAEQSYPDPARLELPLTTASIGNFGGGTCAGGGSITLDQAMVVSCNTTFAQIGLDLGPEGFVDAAEEFGLNDDTEFQLPTVPSLLPRGLDEPSTAQSAIGQRDVQVTPLQMALITASIANDGLMMRPRIVREVVDNAGRQVRSFSAQEERRTVSSDTARSLTGMMTRVVSSGTGTGAQLSGVEVAGKTGTAQRGEGRNPTVWFTGFAPVDDPRVAVVVMLEGEDLDAGATGGGVAAPVARDIMQAALGAGPGTDTDDEGES